MTLFSQAIQNEFNRMLKNGISDATVEEALARLLQHNYQHRPWMLYEVFTWTIRYHDYRSDDTELFPLKLLEHMDETQGS